MGRCTPYQKALRKHQEQAANAPAQPYQRSFARDLALGTALAKATAGVVYSVRIPFDGIAAHPTVRTESVQGDVMLVAKFNGESAATLPLSPGVNRIDVKPFPVKQGDLVEIVLEGEGSVDSLQVGFFLRQ